MASKTKNHDKLAIDAQQDDSFHMKRVALIVDTGHAPRRRMLNGIARYMQEHKPWSIYIKPTRVEKSLDKWLRNWDGDGVIAAVHEPDVGAVLSHHVPVVDIVGILQFKGIPLVHANDRSIGRLGAEHLIERGFKTFAFCEYPQWPFSVNRRIGFVEALQKLGLTCNVNSLPMPFAGIGGPENWEAQQRSLTRWLTELPKPVGIMATSDLVGQQILEACQRLRIRVPDAVAVVGADNDEPICMLSHPPMSSVVINDQQRGYEAAALLDRMMNGEAPPKETTFIEPAGVVARASTDIMATDDEAVITAMRFLRQHSIDNISVDDVVERVPLCRSMLERRFKRIVGRSVSDEIIRLKLENAINLLTQTELELKVVAARSGFQSLSYMCTVFRKHVGRTPGSYKMGTNGHIG